MIEQFEDEVKYYSDWHNNGLIACWSRSGFGTCL